MNDEQIKELFLIHHSSFIVPGRRRFVRFHAHSLASSILTCSWPLYIVSSLEKTKEPVFWLDAGADGS
jgi:hypothetical protein